MKRLIAAIMMAVLMVGVTTVRADTIGLHLGSWHSKPAASSGQRYENWNPGIYWRDESGIVVGAYRNSYGRNSAYAGWHVETDGQLSVAFTAALATGYPGRAVRPMLVPSIARRFGSFGVRLAIMPKIGQSTTTVAHVMLETSWN